MTIKAVVGAEASILVFFFFLLGAIKIFKRYVFLLRRPLGIFINYRRLI